MLEFLDYLCIPFWIDDASEKEKKKYGRIFFHCFVQQFLPDRVNKHSQQIIYESIHMLTFTPGEIGKDDPYYFEIEKVMEDYQKSLNKNKRLSSQEEKIVKVNISSKFIVLREFF